MGKTDVQKQFGLSVRSWRNRRGFSQEELAERAGLHRTYVCDIERGARNVSLKSIDKLANALNIPCSTLFDYTSSQAQSSAKPVASERMAQILLVENDPNDIEVTARALRNARFVNRISVARDGAEALDLIFNSAAHDHQPVERPHVVLLDLNLPKVSGLEVLRRLKEDVRTKSIPVVMLTASKFDRDIMTSRKLGADAHIVKPVDFANLAEVISQLSLQWALLKPGQELAP